MLICSNTRDVLGMSDPSSFSSSVQRMPWLVHSLVPDFTFVLGQGAFGLFSPHVAAIAAFGSDGHLQTEESNLLFKQEWNPKYEFIADQVFYYELVHFYKLDMDRLKHWHCHIYCIYVT